MGFGAPGSSKSTLNLEDLMRLGVRTAKAGNKEGARVIFQQVLDTDKRNERAWLWMAFVADNDIDRRRYLETVLKLDPQNKAARKQLAQMDQAIRGSEGASLRLGVMIVTVLVIALVVVAVIVFAIARL
jgi:Tfp pilus assembly protein PilF